MRTLYAACIARLGLSQAEAATYHNVGLQSVKNWCAGRSSPPSGIWSELRAYEAQIVDRSEAIREAWEDAGEQRRIDAQTNGDPLAMMAMVDFFLGSDVEIDVREVEQLWGRA